MTDGNQVDRCLHQESISQNIKLSKISAEIISISDINNMTMWWEIVNFFSWCKSCIQTINPFIMFIFLIQQKLNVSILLSKQYYFGPYNKLNLFNASIFQQVFDTIWSVPPTPPPKKRGGYKTTYMYHYLAQVVSVLRDFSWY